MSSANDLIQGLNLLPRSAVSHTNNTPSGNANDLLVNPYADLAQLDLWTTVNFASDEPSNTGLGDDDSSEGDKDEKSSQDSSNSVTTIKRKRDYLAKKPFFPAANLSSDGTPIPFNPAVASAGLPYDLPTLLALTNNQFSSEAAMNLNPLFFGNPYVQPGFGLLPAFQPPPPSSTDVNPPPAKKSRSRKPSTSHSPPAKSSQARPQSPQEEEPMSPGAEDRPLTSAEDKRRRNTQASARFRLKKKEREAAMEGKCKILEGKVGELERECEALRRENGWLKGLVVGVTGGTGVPLPSVPTGSSSNKRKRDQEHLA